jgi:hypothetical protein
MRAYYLLPLSQMYTEQANIGAPTLPPLTFTDIMSISRATYCCYISSAIINAALILSAPSLQIRGIL